MNKRRGLGKGLEALIPVVERKEEQIDRKSNDLREIEITEIQPAQEQARKKFNEDKLAELAASIKQNGVLQPVIVRPLAEGGYQLIAGERRWRACMMLSMQTIPAVIKEYQDLDASAISLIENVQREDLSPLEEAAAYKRLLKEHKLTQEEVSGRVGKSRSFVANMVRLLDLTEEVKEMLAEGRLTAGHARALLAIHNPKEQIEVALKAESQQLSVRQMEKRVNELMQEKKDKGRESISEVTDITEKKYVQEIEEIFKKQLGGIAVTLRESKSGAGKLEIKYNNQEELKGILETLLGKEVVSRETFF